MTKKEEQNRINELCTEKLNCALDEIRFRACMLRTCSAIVSETEHFYILTSYKTPIACIEKSSDTLYDCLIIVYGYSATSAQHISKFEKDYCQGKRSCLGGRYTAR